MNIKIRNVTIEDAQLLFEWANDPEIRENSFHQGAIEWNDHIVWLNNKLHDSSCKMFIFHQNNNPIGFVRLENDENAVISVTVASDKRGKGFGTEIIKMACSKFWGKSDRSIFGYIKESNKASLKACKKAGFKFLRSDFLNQIPYFILIAEKNGNKQY